MARAPLTGSRIRERRLFLGRRQADLARAVGISPSYLNLIEHNRRRIGGKLVTTIARELRVEPSALTEGAEAALLDALREAAGDHTAAREELSRVEEFVGRFPGWAALLADTRRRATALERTVEVLSDRMAHDPFLSTSLHEVLSTITSIRSSATILADTPDIDPTWRSRFHRNIAEDSQRLTDGAEALVRYLDESANADVTGSTPQEEVDAWLRSQSYHIADMERALAPEPDVLVRRSEALRSPTARDLAGRYLLRYRRDATQMPLAEITAALRETGIDPAALARRFGVDLGTAFRRLASLPEEVAGRPIGLVSCDGSGTLTFRKPIPGFGVPRFSAACSLWPLYEALTHPLAPIRRPIVTAGREPQAFIAYGVCQPAEPTGFDGPAILEATMLIVPDERAAEGAADTASPQIVGTSCRICPRDDCPARREPAIMTEGF